jgi:hypothetical protein
MSDFSFLAEDIKTWLPRVLYRHTEDDTLGRCKRIVARQLNAHGRDVADVHQVRLDGDDFSSPAAVEMISNELAQSLQQDADGMGGNVQRYALYAYFEKAPQQAAFRKAIMVAGRGPLEGEDGGLTERPDTTGLVTQLMRHLEIQNKNSMVAMGYLFATQQKQMERLMETNEAKDKRQFDLMVLLEEVISTKHEREVRMEEVKAGIEFKKKGIEKLEVLFPVVMNKVAKTNLYPEKASPAALAAAAFFDSLTPKQAEIFRQVLSPEQLTALAEVVTSVEKARQGEETAENKIKEVIKDRVIGMAKEKEKPRQIRARVEPGDGDGGDDTNPLDDLGLSRAQRFLLEQAVKMPPDKLEEVKKKLTPDQRKFLEETLPKVQEKMKGKDRK